MKNILKLLILLFTYPSYTNTSNRKNQATQTEERTVKNLTLEYHITYTEKQNFTGSTALKHLLDAIEAICKNNNAMGHVMIESALYPNCKTLTIWTNQEDPKQQTKITYHMNTFEQIKPQNFQILSFFEGIYKIDNPNKNLVGYISRLISEIPNFSVLEKRTIAEVLHCLEPGCVTSKDYRLTFKKY